MNKKGFTGLELMAAVTVIGILCAMIVAVSGCTKLYPVPVTPVCSAPEATGSVLCAIAVKGGTTPEQMNDMLLDVSLLSIGTKITTGPQLREAVAKVQKYIVDHQILTVQGIIGYLVGEAQIDPALAMLLSRRLVFLQVPGLDVQALTPFDVGLVKKHLENQLSQLSWF